ncbi:MAG: MerR family transcriptional regulator [Clostridia bacterium]|nr:MerR family transcriptional regulator [Clostridia bacterium]
MEYTVHKLSEIAGVSERTLRYYDQIGLLKPNKINASGYRIYSSNEVDVLQQILFYKELGIELSSIKKIITNPKFDYTESLKKHLLNLEQKKENLEILINNVKNTILSKEGDKIMSDKEKFEGFKNKMIEENEEKYGDEIREKYGNEEIEASNRKIKNMTKEDYDKIQKLSLEVNETLKLAFEQGDPTSELAMKACKLHKEWLTYFWSSY